MNQISKQQEARTQLGNEIANWSIGKNMMLLELPTSTGKTWNSLNILTNKGVKGQGLVLVPEITLQQNFKDDAHKHGFGSLIDNADVICYASLGKYVSNQYSWCVMDECHRATSELRADLLQKLNCSVVIALSATVGDETEDILNSIFPFKKFSLTASEAIERGILPEPEIRIIELELDNKVVRNEFSYGKKKVKCTDRGYYQRLSDSISYWKDLYEDEGKDYQKNKMLSEGSKRQRFLGKCKTDTVKELLSEIGKERAIIFCSSVDQANEIGSKLVVSSEKTKKQNKEIIDAFNFGKTTKIFSKGMLKEGMNLWNCKYGIVTQLNNQERDLVQQLGRILRNSAPVLYVLIFKNTVDERFFNKSFKNIDEQYINKST